MEKINHESEVERVLYAQYRNSQKVIEWLKVNARYANQFEDMSFVLGSLLDIDRQAGAQLDIVGNIVRQKRGQVDKDILDWFGWLENKLRKGYGQAPWLPRDVAKYDRASTPDDIYRVLLKAKAAKNNSRCTVDGVIDAVEFISGTPIAGLDNRQDMTFTITFAKALPLAEKTVIQNFDIIPRPQGVRLISIAEPATEKYFGYIGDPFATPYQVEPYAKIIKEG